MRNRIGLHRAVIAVAAVAVFAGCSSSSEEPASDGGIEDVSAIDQMQLAFNEAPSTREIQEAMDNALNATNTPISEDTYSRAGSTVVSLRKEYGINEMDILECIPSMTTDRRIPEVTFPNVAAVCSVAFVEGER